MGHVIITGLARESGGLTENSWLTRGLFWHQGPCNSSLLVKHTGQRMRARGAINANYPRGPRRVRRWVMRRWWRWEQRKMHAGQQFSGSVGSDNAAAAERTGKQEPGRRPLDAQVVSLWIGSQVFCFIPKNLSERPPCRRRVKAQGVSWCNQSQLQLVENYWKHLHLLY